MLGSGLEALSRSPAPFVPEPFVTPSLRSSVDDSFAERSDAAVDSSKKLHAASAKSASPFDVVPQALLDPPDIPIRGSSRTDAGVVLDRELVKLAGMEARCRLILAKLVRRLVDTRGWRPLGFVRLSDYARERVGLSPRALEEDARVVRGLDALPLLRAALDAGILNWTKVRMLIRVATVENEKRLIERAMGLTTRELEEFLRCEMDEVGGDEVPPLPGVACDAQPQASAVIAEEPEVRWSIGVSRTGRRLWRAAREFASRHAGGPLSNAQVLELVMAEAASGAQQKFVGADAAWTPPFENFERNILHLQRVDEDRGRRCLLSFIAETGVAEGFAWLAPASLDVGPAVALDGLLANLEEIDAFELDRRLREVRLAKQRIDWQMAALLRTGIDRRLFREIGFATVKLYVESRLGCSARRVWSLVRIERETWRSCAELRAAWSEGRVSYLAACTILPVMGHHHGKEWIARAGEVTLRRLEDEVAWALEHGELPCFLGRPAPPPRGADLGTRQPGDVTKDEVQMRACSTEPERTFRPIGEVRLAFRVPLSTAALAESVMYQWSMGIEAPWRAFERILAAALLEWMSAPRHRDPVFDRDNWRCTVPGCTSRRNLHDHHVTFRSHGGDNARGNRTTVCAAHHLHGIHLGVVSASGVAPDDLTWELGCRAGREPLMRMHGDRYAS